MEKFLAGLNDKQQEAVTSEDKRVLVLAGAGSGKTQTLIQKILYLIKIKRVKPSEILAITFTKNAANEMIDRLILSVDRDGSYSSVLADRTLNQEEKSEFRRKKVKQYPWIDNLTIRTFHSLCYTILRSFGANEFDNQFRIIDDDYHGDDAEVLKYSAPVSIYELLHNSMITACNDKEYMLSFKRYLLDYFVDKIHIETRAAARVSNDGKFYTSLNGTKVRSKSEQYICDWLYRHNLKFVYEPNVQFHDIAFFPDFFIPAANLYLEHVSKLSKGMPLKEEQFNLGGKVLIKTYESMTSDTAIFNMALDRIFKKLLPPHYDTSLVLNYEEEFRGKNQEIRNFLRQVLRVMDMIKVEGLNINQVYEKSKKDQHERVRDFYKLAIPLIGIHEKNCIDKSYLDFNDLNIRAINLLRKNKEIQQKYYQHYKYMLVDEFQDVNKLQVKFIRTLLNPDAQLFCVGDDWQSIYGFRGSDVRYIVQFSNFFKNSKVISLDTNYRSTQFIVDASTEVIRNNKFIVDKNIRAHKSSRKKIEVYTGLDQEDCIEYCVKEVKELIALGILQEDIMFLYRRSKMFDPYRQAFQRHKIKINGKTIHASKGLQSKIVFIIGLTQGNGGFPDIWMEDRIYQLIRPVKYDLLLEEERRLFYVALTRAEDQVYLVSILGNESIFIDEIPEQYKVLYSRPIKELKVNQLLCINCGKRMDDHFKYCPFCGAYQN
mgnify:CR=1 FL=1